MTRHDPGPTIRVRYAAIAILTLAAIALRITQFGNPLYDVDEQFYLLVGDRITHGALPYVDIWDRKPIGLFLIYAAARLFGGDGVIAFQILATLCAAATAVGIAAIARTMARPSAAVGAGLAYLVWLNLMGGGSGQSPVFYDLLTVSAAYCTMTAFATGDAARQNRLGDAAMLAMGLALQIKPTTAIEGCLFGIAFLYRARTHGLSPAGIAMRAIRLVGIALLPFAIALLWYAALGHLGDIWFATIVSVFLRSVPPTGDPVERLTSLAIVLSPLILTGLIAVLAKLRDGGTPLRLTTLWMLAAIVAFLLVPPYFNHYALPMLPPLCVLAARALDSGRIERRFALRSAVAIVAAAMLWLSGFPDIARTRTARARQANATALVLAHRPAGHGCLFVFEGPPALYRTTGLCAATRYMFPDHLNSLSEAKALGVDPASEVARTLATRPAMILSIARARFPDPNPATWSLVETALAADYTPVGTVTTGTEPATLYVRRTP